MQDTFDVFFSYHWRDHAVVERIARSLIDRSLSIFFDCWYLAPGQPWQQALEAALGRCRAVAIFLGAELGPWQQREKYLALDRQGRSLAFPLSRCCWPAAIRASVSSSSTPGSICRWVPRTKRRSRP